MEALYPRPYTINQDLGKGLYEFKNKEGKVIKKKANISDLKVFSRRGVESVDEPQMIDPDPLSNPKRNVSFKSNHLW